MPQVKVQLKRSYSMRLSLLIIDCTDGSGSVILNTDPVASGRLSDNRVDSLNAKHRQILYQTTLGFSRFVSSECIVLT